MQLFSSFLDRGPDISGSLVRNATGLPDGVVMPGILGINDPQIILGYALSIGFALVCIAYGLVYWKSGAEN
jgi:hypothetical protein